MALEMTPKLIFGSGERIFLDEILIFFSKFPKNAFLDIFTHTSNSLLFTIEFQSSTKYIWYNIVYTTHNKIKRLHLN
jgi:hypothetical protein